MPDFRLRKDRLGFDEFHQDIAIFKRNTYTSPLLFDQKTTSKLQTFESDEVCFLVSDDKKIIFKDYNIYGAATLLYFLRHVFFPILCLSSQYPNATFIIDESYTSISRYPDALSFLINILNKYKIKTFIVKKEIKTLYINNYYHFILQDDPVRHHIIPTLEFLKDFNYTKYNDKTVFYGISKNNKIVKNQIFQKYCDDNNIDILYEEDIKSFSELIKIMSKVKIFISIKIDDIYDATFFCQNKSTIVFLEMERERANIFHPNWEQLSESGKILIHLKEFTGIHKTLNELNNVLFGVNYVG